MEKFDAIALAHAYSDMVELTRHNSFRRYATQDRTARALVDRFDALQTRLGVTLYNASALKHARLTADRLDAEYVKAFRELFSPKAKEEV